MSITSTSAAILVIGTGGTIAGVTTNPVTGGYHSGVLPINKLLSQISSKFPIKNNQLCNIDSCDLSESLLSKLGQEVLRSLEDPGILGIVITHGTDTMEETATFLELVCGQHSRDLGKNVVLTGAMFPSDHPMADGPKNLSQAIQLIADQTKKGGVWAMMGSKLISGLGLVKGHSSSIDAFLEEPSEGRPQKVSDNLPIPPINNWPWVEIITSHTGARPDVVQYLQDRGVQGIVLAGTGAGTVHEQLSISLQDFIQAGGAVVRASRIGRGPISEVLANGRLSGALGAGSLNPAKARIALQLALFASAQDKANALSWHDFFAKIVRLPDFR